MTPVELAKLFTKERARFARHVPRLARAILVMDSAKCTPGSPCGRRDVAYCDRRDNVVVVLERALRLSRNQLTGLIRHELGHLADPTPSRPGAEARADAIAYEVTGQRIRYDRAAIQTVGKGRKTRPKHLHQ